MPPLTSHDRYFLREKDYDAPCYKPSQDKPSDFHIESDESSSQSDDDSDSSTAEIYGME